MPHQIHIHNYSSHDQQFEHHGNNGKVFPNLIVHAHGAISIPAADGDSGALIALHDGHEGEQVEYTKAGFGGNDFIDLSNILGAGGNLIVQQVGSPDTRKGDPHFMQDFNRAWDKADKQTRDGLKTCVHLDSKGNVKRIDAIKNFPKLEAFVRHFANGMTYIGVGSWGGSPGNPHDNKQSAAAKGSKDLLVVYSDEDATPRTLPKHPAQNTVKKIVAQNAASDSNDLVEHDIDDSEAINVEDGPEPAEGAAQAIAAPVIQKTHAPEIKMAAQAPITDAAVAKGTGVTLINHASHEQKFAFYNNYWNGNGTGGANFDHPAPVVTVPSKGQKFVALASSFKGRVQRGTLLPATWAEFQLKASNDGKAHGDISLEQGCDGAAMIHATDGSGQKNGFSHDILKDAPRAAIMNKSNGVKALASTMGNWMAGPNHAAAEYEQKVVGQKHAYILGGTGTDDTASANGRFEIEFFEN
ncbi:MAG: hypothetical protein Q9227_005502 [Pyrenula ochraceoflavens]